MNSGEMPLVSILMTAYNREKYIAAAIESVLASTYKNFELIIVDDGSTDNTVAIARVFEEKDKRVKLFINEKNLGDYVNRNKAASLASGKYLKYVDSDDLIYSYGIEIFVQAMESYPEAAIGITSKSIIPLTPFPILLSPVQSYKRHFFETGLLDYGPTGVIIRKSIFDQYNGFSGKRFIGDQELWFKIAARHSIIELPPSLTFWRQHDSQEFKAGGQTIDTGYFMMRLPLIKEALENPDCPLSESQKKAIIKKNEKQYALVLAKHVIKTGEIRKGLKKFSELKLSLANIF